MLRKISILMIWVLATCVAFANAPNSSSSTSGGPGCNLPAPLNFHVVQAAPTWVRLSWNPIVPGVYKHRIKTFEKGTNILLSNVVVPANLNTIDITNLPYGVDCYSEINTICLDDTDSYFIATAGSPTGIISDLIVSGFTNTTNSPDCSAVVYGPYCTFPITPNVKTYFQVRPTNGSTLTRQFRVFKLSNTTTLRAEVDTAKAKDYKSTIDDKPPVGTYGTPGTDYRIYDLSGLTHLATFQIYFNMDDSNNFLSGILNCSYLAPNYELIRRSGGSHYFSNPNGVQEEGEDREAYQTDIPKFSAFPNPFTESLEVYLGPKNQVPVHLQLLNLNGQIVHEQRNITDQEFVTLSTASLSPGFYMLRIEADGQVQTLKVIKSE